MKKLKLIVIFAASGFLLSLICGIVSGAAFLSLIIKAFIWGIVFGAIGGGISILFDSVLSTDSSTDMGDTGSETSASRSTGNVVDIRVDDDELESSEHENAYLVGSGHQMLNADDLRNAVSPVRRQASGTVVADMKAPGADSMAAENKSAASPKDEGSGFVPISNLGSMYNSQGKEAASSSTPVSSAGNDTASDDDLDVLPDVGDLNFAGSSQSGSDSFNNSVNNESDFATGSKVSAGTNSAMMGNSELIAKAISSVLAREN